MRSVIVTGSLILMWSSAASAADKQPPAAPKKEIRLTLSSGAGVVSADGTTPLHWAVQGNDLAAVERLLRGGASANAATRYGVTPLSLAATNGNAPMVSALLQAGANPNGISLEGEPVLMSAARSGNLRVVEALLERGADPNAREKWLSQTALMWAAAENHADVVRTLLKHGADPLAKADLLEYWAMTPSEPATPKVNTPKGGMAALHYAARQGAADAVKAFIAAGVDLNQTDPDGATALLYATLNGHYNIAAALLDAGADPNRADQYGRTVLFAAFDMNRMEREPRPQVKTEDETRPLDLAAMALGKGANRNARITGRIPTRCANGCYSVGAEGATPLWRASRGNDIEGVTLLLASGADPAIGAKDGSTPLMVAAGQIWRDEHSLGTEEDSIEVIKWLLAAGVDINEVNDAGETALHGAAQRGAPAVIKFLVQNGADLEATDYQGRTPLDMAMGVNLTVRNGGGEQVPAQVRVAAAKMLRELMASPPASTPFSTPFSTTPGSQPAHRPGVD